ncbi:MAG: DPP IV N-terminal domain-containing protein, partial [Blastocatellia bacterium]
ASQARQITFGARNKDGWRGLAWTPDGKIVYRSEAGGNPHIRMTAADGTGNKQLSPDTHQNLDPTVSPDGRFIAWTSAPTGVRNIWRMDLNGSNLQQLTDGSGEWYPQYTPNGKWLVYQGLDPGPRRRLLWKKPLDGGAPELLTNHTSYAPVVSPNGKLVAFNYQSEADAPFKMAVIPFEGGDIKPFDLIGPEDRSLRWTPDGSGLAYILTRDGVSNIWSQPAAGGRAKQMTHFDTDRIVNFAWSRDGRLALSRGTDNIDVVMISNFR